MLYADFGLTVRFLEPHDASSRIQWRPLGVLQLITQNSVNGGSLHRKYIFERS